MCQQARTARVAAHTIFACYPGRKDARHHPAALLLGLSDGRWSSCPGYGMIAAARHSQHDIPSGGAYEPVCRTGADQGLPLFSDTR